jgi:hypothetical protein
MTPEAPLENPWETPALEPDLGPIHIAPPTAQSTETLTSASSSNETSAEGRAQSHDEARIDELERQNRYLFRRNVVLVARVAELEVANQRLSEKVSALKQSASRTPWFMRWIRSQ